MSFSIAVVGSEARKKVMSVKVSIPSHKKALQLQKFMDYASAVHAWGKDEKLLRCNLLLVPNNINYTVLLAMGKYNR